MSMEKVLIGVLICLTTISWVVDIKIGRATRKYSQWEGARSTTGVEGDEARDLGNLAASSYTSLAGRAGAVGTVVAIIIYLVAKDPLSPLVMVSALTIVFILIILFLGIVKADSATRLLSGGKSLGRSKRHPDRRA